VDTYLRLVTMVEQKAGLGRVGADRATRATIDAFFERLSGGQARDLAARLPKGFVQPAQVLPDRPPESFDLDTFLRRVAEQEGTDPATAEEHATAVLTALRVIVGADEYAEAVAQLPQDFSQLIAETERPHVAVGSATEFVDRVAERARLDGDAAGRVTDAVLATLGERIPEPQASRLGSQLPAPLGDAVVRGVAETTAPRGLPADKFVGRVAEREGATPEQAYDHTRAVLVTIGDALPEQEFHDTVVRQLPDDYAGLLAPR
jgi:uncharacterized protein (DUF2267 family)